MGVEYYLACWKHRERMPLGKLGTWYDMVAYFIKRKRKAIPKWLPSENAKVLNDVREFQTRHKGCRLQMYSDHHDVGGDTLCVTVEDLSTPLTTQEDFVKYAEKHAVPIVINPTTVKMFIESDIARKWGAKDRYIPVTFKKRWTPPGLDTLPEDDPQRVQNTVSIYIDEEGNEYIR